jgi:riboflavin kinase/FMN adenylyltransferase
MQDEPAAKSRVTQDLSGIVQPFKGNGRRLGYPTANLSVQTDLVDGVYFGWANLTQFVHQPALIFIGVPTTVGDTERRVETHVLDIPDVDYYGQQLTIVIRYFHRPNQTFTTIDQLIAVMKTDEQIARQWFATQEFVQK